MCLKLGSILMKKNRFSRRLQSLWQIRISKMYTDCTSRLIALKILMKM